MTREEAILLLHEMKDTYDEIHENTNWEIGYKQMTALDMAIEALSAEAVEVVRCKDCKHKNDGSLCVVAAYINEDGNGFCNCGERRKP